MYINTIFSSRFVLDLDRDHFVAKIVFKFVTVYEDACDPKKSEYASRSQQLELASIDGEVNIHLKEKYLHQMVSLPELKVVFDDKLR
jgi:hypothetical protein